MKIHLNDHKQSQLTSTLFFYRRSQTQSINLCGHLHCRHFLYGNYTECQAKNRDCLHWIPRWLQNSWNLHPFAPNHVLELNWRAIGLRDQLKCCDLNYWKQRPQRKYRRSYGEGLGNPAWTQFHRARKRSWELKHSRYRPEANPAFGFQRPCSPDYLGLASISQATEGQAGTATDIGLHQRPSWVAQDQHITWPASDNFKVVNSTSSISKQWSQ